MLSNTFQRYPFYFVLLFLVLLTAGRAWVVADLNLPLYVDEAQYWFWSVFPDWGYYSKPPMIAMLIGLTTLVCGDSEFCIRSGALLMPPLTAVVIFYFTSRLSNRQYGIWAAVLYLTIPLVSVSSLFISTDALLLFFWAVALFSYWNALKEDHWHWWLLTGLVAGLGLLTKYTMGVFAISALIHLFIIRRPGLLKSPRLHVALAIAFLLWLPNLIWNYQHGFITFLHTAEISGQQNKGLHFSELFEFWGGQLAVLGPVFVFLWLYTSYDYWRYAWKNQPTKTGTVQLYLVVFSWVFFAVISLQAVTGQANANWAAPFVVTSVMLIAIRFAEWRRPRLLMFAAALNVLIMLLVYFYQPILHAMNIEMKRGNDLFARVKGGRELGEQFKSRLQQYPDATLMASRRDIISLLYYYARPEKLASWNTTHRIRHHFDINYSLNITKIRLADEISTSNDRLQKDSEFLWVMKPVEKIDPEKYFNKVIPLHDLSVKTHKDNVINYRIFYVTDPKQTRPADVVAGHDIQ